MPKRATAKATKPAGKRAAKAYEAVKERARAIAAARSLSGRDIGSIPRIADPKRRAACARDLRKFCETYFPELFALAWSDDHLNVIAVVVRVVLEGGLFAFAMPRGSGKTTLIEVAVLWAVLYGYRRFVVVIGPHGDHATQMLESIKIRLVTNDALLADFPEVCYPIRKLEGIAQRAGGQLCQGKATRVGWSSDFVRMPTIDGSAAAGAIIAVRSITGSIRGMKVDRPDGSSARPDLVLIDDPQTDESARSPSQCAERERVIQGAILGLAGPGKKIAALATVTVICQDDLADRLLDRKRYPQWQGQRMRMLYAIPTNEKLWAEYAKAREQSLEEHGDIRDATAFYRNNRKELDAGAVAAWPARFNPDEASAVQHAMNWKIGSPAAFWAECQNDPAAFTTAGTDELKPDDIASRITRIPRGIVPTWATRLSMFIDIQKNALYWLVAAWSDDFSGTIIDYGTEPDQRTHYFTYREVRRTLSAAAPGAGLEGSIFAGLERLTEYTLGREWNRDGGGAAMRIEKCLIDANWGPTSALIYKFCRQSQYANVITPSHGMYYGATKTPISQYRTRVGERKGENWYMPAPEGKKAIRHVVFDTNWWKSFVETRLATAIGDPGALTLFGDEPRLHRMLADQLTAERKTPVESKGRKIDEWKIRAPGRDNHLLDATVGAAVAASMLGCQPPGGAREVETKRKRVPLSQMMRRSP